MDTEPEPTQPSLHYARLPYIQNLSLPNLAFMMHASHTEPEPAQPRLHPGGKAPGLLHLPGGQRAEGRVQVWIVCKVMSGCLNGSEGPHCM